MDEIKALNKSAGKHILAVLSPTYNIFTPYLIQNKYAIKSIRSETKWYGDHPRQTLDVYSPEPSTLSPTAPAPILVFLHGGGLTHGDKILTDIPQGLVYANLGSFFAKRGIITVIPNYRRVDFEGGGEGAKYPSGGEDVALVMRWLERYSPDAKRDVYLLGNSAGGLHIATFLLDPRFEEQRRGYVQGEGRIVLKGVVELSAPFSYKGSEPRREKTLKAYYGDEDSARNQMPYGLLEALTRSGKTRLEAAVPKVLALLAEYDPPEEIGESMNDFVALWKRKWGTGIEFTTLMGHNHISPPLALMSGDIQGEKWGEGVVKWINLTS